MESYLNTLYSVQNSTEIVTSIATEAGENDPANSNSPSNTTKSAEDNTH